MSKTSLIRLCATALLLVGGWAAYTQNPPAAQLTLEKVKEDLYVIVGDGGNVAVYVTSEGVILVDDKFERNYADIQAKVKSVTDKPVKYVLNTHQHGDHTGGNEKLLPSAEILIHKNARANMVSTKMPGLPRITYTDETDVFLGGKEVRGRYFGRGHTNGDTIIYFPALKVIHTGDLCTNGAPYLDYSAGAAAIEWTKTLDNVLQSDWDFDTVIPGHGPVFKRDDLMKYKQRLEAMRNRISGLVRGGKSKEEVGQTLISEFGWNASGVQRSADGLIAELKR